MPPPSSIPDESQQTLAKAGGDYLKLSEHQAKVGALSAQDVAIQRQQIEYRNQFANDPKGFDTAWTNYSDGILSSTDPRFIDHARATLGSTGNTAYSAILNETRVQSDADAKQSWAASEQMAANEVLGHAMAGTAGTDAGRVAGEKYRNVVATGVSSQFIPQAVADQHLGTVEASATVYAARDHIKSTFDNQGPGPSGPIDAIKQIDDITRDPNLNLTPDQRLTLNARMRADVHGWDAERAHNVATVDLQAQALISKQGGQPPPQSMIDDVVDRFKRFGAPANAATFLSDLQHSESMSFIPRMPLAQSAAWLNQQKANLGFGGPAAPPAVQAAINEAASSTGVPASYLYKTASRESGFDPNAQASTSSAGGLFQFTGSTWEKTLGDYGAKYGLAPGTSKFDARANALMAAEFTKQNGQLLEAAGNPVNDGTLYLAHFAGAGGANRLLKADPSARAADLLPDAAAANRSIFFGKDGSARSVGDVVSGLTGGRQSAAPITPSASNITYIGKASEAVSKRVSDEADAIVAGMNDQTNPVLPDPQRINTLLDAAAATNTPEVLDKVAKAAGEYQFRRDFGRAPLANETAYVSDLHQKAVTEGLSTTDARHLQIAQQVYDRTAKALQDDPLTHTIGALADSTKMPPPAPLNVGDSASFQAGLQIRAQWAGVGTQTFQTAPMPALTATDVTQVRAALDAANPAGKARIFGDMVAALPQETTLAATLAKLGEKGGTGAVEAAAGGLMAEAPDIAQSILRGQQAIKTEKNFAPDVKPADFQQEMAWRLPLGTFSLAGRTDATGPRKRNRQRLAAHARRLKR